MNHDFHFYATYLACRGSGWNNTDSVKIANAAGFVDHFNGDVAKRVFPKDVNRRHSFPSGLADMATEYSTWTVFHFVPGNKPAHPGLSDQAEKRSCQRESLADRHSLTRPLGAPILMIMDRIGRLCSPSNQNKPEHYLYLLGIAAHVFGDTWAHQDFSGFNSNLNKKAGPIEVRMSDGRWRTWSRWHTSGVMQQSPQGKATPGHGRLSSLPDMAFATFRYQPPWNSGKYIRNNPKEFLDAFKAKLDFFSFAKDIRADKTFAEVLSEASEPRTRGEKSPATMRNGLRVPAKIAAPSNDVVAEAAVREFVNHDMAPDWFDNPPEDTFYTHCKSLWAEDIRAKASQFGPPPRYTAKSDWPHSNNNIKLFHEAAKNFWFVVWRSLYDCNYSETLKYLANKAKVVKDHLGCFGRVCPNCHMRRL